MAAPNIVTVNSITCKSVAMAVPNTATALVTNPALSGKVIKINSLYVSNVDGANAGIFTCDLFRGAVAYRIASTISIPINSTLDVISRVIYLEEGDVLRVTASAALDLEVVCSYEEIA